MVPAVHQLFPNAISIEPLPKLKKAPLFQHGTFAKIDGQVYHQPIDLHAELGVAEMQYQRSSDIERRLEAVLTLIRSGEYSAPMIARELEISIPTVSRDVTALKERAHDILSERRDEGWRYVLVFDSKKGPLAGPNGLTAARR
jgi:biotin operon repressor